MRTEELTAEGAAAQPGQETPWKRHTIDDTSRGADGAKLTDVNDDGLMDIDRDGDLDIITCEEQEGKRGLGLFWYENPFSGRGKE